MLPPIAKVVLDVPLAGTFDYLAPGVSAQDIGQRVSVPFGPRKMVGIIVALSEDSDIPPERLKSIAQVFRETPPFSPEMFRLLRFCSEYYHHPLGEVIFNALPNAMRQTKPLTLRNPVVRMEYYRLTDQGRQADPAALPARAVVKRRLLLALHASSGLRREEIVALSSRAPAFIKEFAMLGWVEESAPPLSFPACSSAHGQE
jgi:primosomal protein N' (replication factor Y) (superfamily II helicase)